jgi:hypothetical protein
METLHFRNSKRMSDLTPIYTRQNCRFSAPLQWSLSIFWREAEPADQWMSQLSTDLRPDGLRLLSHSFANQNNTSQFAISTLPHVVPTTIIQRTKGRLYHLVRDRKPKPFKGNYAIRSIGSGTRQAVENYAADQLGHHQMADPDVQDRLSQYQVVRPEIDLSERQQTSHGVYWYNLHVVMVHRERWMEIRHDVLSRVRAMVLGAAAKNSIRLSRAGILADHLHLVLGCPIDLAPDEIALAFLNNLAFVHGMKPIYQFGGFIGTIGEYTNKAI